MHLTHPVSQRMIMAAYFAQDDDHEINHHYHIDVLVKPGDSDPDEYGFD